jgi:acetyl-CoA acetyltransferase family protein
VGEVVGTNRQAVVVDALRTPMGRRNGALGGWHPVDLAAACLEALAARNGDGGFEPGLVDDVVLGCVSQIGAQSSNVARYAALAAGWPDSVGGVTVERQGDSAAQALHVAAQAIVAGAADVVVAGGVEVPSLVPAAASMGRAYGVPFGPRVTRRYHDGGGLLPEGLVAEALARDAGLDREALDRWALGSHRRALQATEAGSFAAELVAVARRTASTGGSGGPAETQPAARGLLRTDETVAAVTAEELASLRPRFDPAGVITAGNSAQIADGASACLVMEAATAERLGCTPLARVAGTAVVGADPRTAGAGPVAATRRLLERTGTALDGVDLVEVQEADAALVLFWLDQLGDRAGPVDVERVNVNGGAIALGDPSGAAGTRQVATLLHELARRGAGTGLSVTAGAGGTATATLFRRSG